MPDYNDNHIRVNIRPIFLSTLGTWDREQRIYSKTLPADEFIECTRTCNSLFNIEAASKLQRANRTDIADDNETCNKFCRKLYSQYVEDSEALLAMKKICSNDDDIKCLQLNKSKINKQIDNLCGDDEPCLINNKNILSMIYQNSSKNKQYAYGKTQSHGKRIGKGKFRSDFKKQQSSKDKGDYLQSWKALSDILITLLIVGILISIILFSK